MREPVYIAGAVRTPIGKFGGTLLPFSAPDLGTVVAKEAMKRAEILPSDVDEVIFGHARQAGTGPNPARQVAHRAGIQNTSPAYTVNRACGSGIQSIISAMQSILMGDASVVVAGGMESMSNTPYYLPQARWGYRLGHAEMVDGMYRDGFHCPIADQLMGRTAETLAERYDISRQEQDRYAVMSQHRCEEARKAGHFEREKTPVMLHGKHGAVPFLTDEHARDAVTLESMAKLPAVFREDGTVHAGNSSGITDGAAAVIVLSATAAERLGVTPMARIVDYTICGVDAKVMGLGPVPAVKKLLERQHLTIHGIDLVELNEAFAAQVIACKRELDLDYLNVNVNGGAIALGHPIGATGTRIVVSLLHEMERRSVGRGLATLCISGGMGMALLLEKP